MTRPFHPRGFTLAELTVSAAVIAFALTLVTAVALNQNKALEGTELLRGSAESSKDALLEIERRLRLAGFGVDPRVAFDFAWFRCSDADRVDGPSGRRLCRDRRDAPDRLVFLSRDPNYRVDPNNTNGCTETAGCPHGRAWRMQAGSPPELTVLARQGDTFVRGQVLLAVCPNGYRWSMATVAEDLSADADGALTLVLYPTDPAVPYFENEYTHPCFGTGATVFAVNRYAYSIETFDGVPWLMLDEGFDLDGDGSDPWLDRDLDDLVPLVPWVEDLQVAYVMERRPGVLPLDTNANFVVGDDPDAATPEEPDPSATAPTYRSGLDDVTRRNLHPANIRAVRLTITVRSERSDPSRPEAWQGDPLPLVENGARVLPSLGRYRRLPLSTTVQVRNLSSRGMFVF